MLISLFKHKGVLKEFSSGEEIVDEIANNFGLTEAQRSAYLETVYKKENRTKRVSLWHRLLFRAADTLAKEKLVSRPTQTTLLTNRREWMLTEDGDDRVMKMLNIPLARKELYPIKSYEIQKIVNQIRVQPRPENYDPQESMGRAVRVSQETRLRSRAFRHTVIEAYGFRCAVCGMKMCSPDAWFTLNERFQVLASHRIQDLPADFASLGITTSWSNCQNVARWLRCQRKKRYIPIRMP